MTRVLLVAFALLAISSRGSDSTNRQYTVTAYCHCSTCCGRSGQPTANGATPTVGVTVAAPRAIPFGTRLRIEGLGERIVQDRQSKKFDDRIDIFMASHEEAVKFGVRTLQVTIIR
jgi:3D (Asp-Asp-Asp) domain-containing protein